jgi:hypothetical protein
LLEVNLILGDKLTAFTICTADWMSYTSKLRRNGGNYATLYTLILASQ